MQDGITTSKATESSTDKAEPMRDVSFLTTEIDRLSSSSDFWVLVGIVLTGAVAVLGVLLFVAQWRAIIVGNSRDSVREELGKAKESVLTDELGKKDKKIATATTGSGTV